MQCNITRGRVLEAACVVLEGIITVGRVTGASWIGKECLESGRCVPAVARVTQ